MYVNILHIYYIYYNIRNINYKFMATILHAAT